jgi:hypothetical protein
LIPFSFSSKYHDLFDLAEANLEKILELSAEISTTSNENSLGYPVKLMLLQTTCILKNTKNSINDVLSTIQKEKAKSFPFVTEHHQTSELDETNAEELNRTIIKGSQSNRLEYKTPAEKSSSLIQGGMSSGNQLEDRFTYGLLSPYVQDLRSDDDSPRQQPKAVSSSTSTSSFSSSDSFDQPQKTASSACRDIKKDLSQKLSTSKRLVNGNLKPSLAASRVTPKPSGLKQTTQNEFTDSDSDMVNKKKKFFAQKRPAANNFMIKDEGSDSE